MPAGEAASGAVATEASAPQERMAGSGGADVTPGGAASSSSVASEALASRSRDGELHGSEASHHMGAPSSSSSAAAGKGAVEGPVGGGTDSRTSADGAPFAGGAATSGAAGKLHFPDGGGNTVLSEDQRREYIASQLGVEHDAEPPLFTVLMEALRWGVWGISCGGSLYYCSMVESSPSLVILWYKKNRVCKDVTARRRRRHSCAIRNNIQQSLYVIV